MKRIFFVLFVLILVFSMAACGTSADKVPETPAQQPTEVVATKPADPNEIVWRDIPDGDVSGTGWKYESAEDDSVIIFTVEGTLRVVSGGFYKEADIKFGTNGMGEKFAFTEGDTMPGTWTYKVEDNKMTVNYTDLKTNEVSDIVLVSTEYTPITVESDPYFYPDDELVGTWINEELGETYVFTEDGYATLDIKDFVNESGFTIDMHYDSSYTVSYGELTMYVTLGNEDVHVEELPFDYFVNGDELTLGVSTYKRVA